MKDQNPNPSSSEAKSPSSRSPSPPPPPSRETTPLTSNPPEEQILKSPSEVLADLSSFTPPPNDEHGNIRSGESGNQRGAFDAAIAAAIAAVGGTSGGSIVIQEGVAEGIKKRKSPAIIDPPNKDPICQVCGRLFASWKAAFGHMRTHPERTYRGFYEPPKKEEEGSSSAAAENAPQGMMLDLDLNEIPEGEGFEYNDTEEMPAAVAEDVPQTIREHAGEEEGRKGVIDLNVTPSNSDEE